MVKKLARNRPEVEADFVLTLQGLGIFVLALAMIQLNVPAVAAVGVEVLLSSVCTYRWFTRRARGLVYATA